MGAGLSGSFINSPIQKSTCFPLLLLFRIPNDQRMGTYQVSFKLTTVEFKQSVKQAQSHLRGDAKNNPMYIYF